MNHSGRHIPTSAISFVETEHGRLRRRQRGIDKKDLQRAKKYGTRHSNRPRPNGDPTAMYKYHDITYIVNEVTGEEITSYANPLKLDPVPIDEARLVHHRRAVHRIQTDLNSWKSNTILVVDTSGSMKTADVWGTRTRLGAVWISIALDFLAHRLETGAASASDVISIVTLCSEPRIVVREQPSTWVLYNDLVQVYNRNLIAPRGHGPFVPCLQLVEGLLTRNPNAACAMALSFLSDGKPSDAACTKGYTKEEWTDKIASSVEHLAKQFGRRLTFAAIGIGDNQDFSTLERMVDVAKDFHAIGMFQQPSMTSSAIGEVFTSVATSLTTTQSEMTDLDTLKQRQVRQVQRVSRSKARQEIRHVTMDDFYVYPVDKIHRTVYREWHEGHQKHHKWVTSNLQHPLAKFVAIEKGPFGEGAERMAYRFFELASDMTTIVGKPKVAKESRLILDGEGSSGDEEARKSFVKVFCRTQQLARRLAEQFNKTLDATNRVHRRTPRVSFLDCSVYQLNDIRLGKQSVLVEERLDESKWHKWNANNGYVEGMKQAPAFSEDELRDGNARLDLQDHLDLIEEGSEDEDESDEEEEQYINVHFSRRSTDPVLFTPSEVAQAFSHFTYAASGKRRLVCDLQGVYNEHENVLQFSDPVIHYYNRNQIDRKNVHGRTDRGKKGFVMFFETHHHYCGHLCRLVNRRFRHGRSATSSNTNHYRGVGGRN